MKRRNIYLTAIIACISIFSASGRHSAEIMTVEDICQTQTYEISTSDKFYITPTDIESLDIYSLNASNQETSPYRLLDRCYLGLAVAGDEGPGSVDIPGADCGLSVYSRALFNANELTTDEAKWIWKDYYINDIVEDRWSLANNVFCGLYRRLYKEISYCNLFLKAASSSSISKTSILEAKTIRALMYYNIIDLFGDSPYIDENYTKNTPVDILSRKQLYDIVVNELKDIVAEFSETTPTYGHIGKDAAEALLARFFLNAETFTGTPAWGHCLKCCDNIIARHIGSGFDGSGLANCYQALFCGNNDKFMPGGSLPEQNEILWGIPYKYGEIEAYGGPTFLIAAATTSYYDYDYDYLGSCSNSVYFGLGQNWKCMHAREQFSQIFGFVNGVSQDKRTLMWATEELGHKISNDQFSSFTDGYLPLKFSNLLCNPDGSFPYTKYHLTNSRTINRFGDPVLNEERTNNPNQFADTDLPLIRLADVYLMAAECCLNGAGTTTQGLQYINIVRSRAGVEPYTLSDFTSDNLLDERARELYWECVRRTDLIRFGKFTGDKYLWAWKGGDRNGISISDDLNLFPHPSVSKYKLNDKPVLDIRRITFGTEDILDLSDGIYLIGEPNGWLTPDESNAERLKDWRLTPIYSEDGKVVLHGCFYVNATDRLEFRFYDHTLSGWGSLGSIGASAADFTYVEAELINGIYNGTFIFGGLGNWLIPNWPGGNLDITVDINNATVTFKILP